MQQQLAIAPGMLMHRFCMLNCQRKPKATHQPGGNPPDWRLTAISRRPIDIWMIDKGNVTCRNVAPVSWIKRGANDDSNYLLSFSSRRYSR